MSWPCPHCGWKPPTYREQKIAETIERMEDDLRARNIAWNWNREIEEHVVARYLGISVDWLQTLRSRGEFNRGRKAGRHWIYQIEEIAEEIVDRSA